MRPQLDSPTLAQQETHWIPLSDLMTGLMMVFLLVAVVFMVKVDADSRRIKEIAVLYERMKNELYTDLKQEFDKDLARWGAEIDPDVTIRFKEPEVLFDTGRADLKARFKQILDEFFPRYVRILDSEKYRDVIQEIRIEGHTSSIWQSADSRQDAYFNNMRLSQERTRSTLQYVIGISQILDRSDWLRAHFTANGLSSSKRIMNSDGTENFSRSQRVEFRVRTDSESRIAKIIEAAE